MLDHYPVPIAVLVMDTTDDMTILPGTARAETQERCGCEWSLAHMFGEGEHQ